MLVGDDRLMSIFESILKEQSKICVYCRPNVYYRIAPNSDFLKKNGIKKTYLYPHYQSKIQEILRDDLSIYATKNKEYESFDMVFVIYKNKKARHTISIKKEPLGTKDRILIDKKAYLIKQKKIADTLLEFFCPEIEEIFK